MVSTISITTLFLHKHVKIASHHLYVVSTISITTPLLYKHVRIILPYQSLRFSYTNMSKSSYTMCIQCPPYQPLHLSFLYKHVKIASHFPSVHYIKHYTFPTQTHQNCVTPFVYGVHHISHYTFPIQTCQNYLTISITTLFLYKHIKIASHYLHMICIWCPPYQSLHFSYTNMSKLRHTTCIWWTPYQSQHFPIQIASTTHFLVNSPLDQSPHIAYTRLPKLRPYTTVQYIHHYTLLQKHAKTASICKCPPYQPLHIPIQTCKKIPSVHHINHYTFPMQTCQNCVTLS